MKKTKNIFLQRLIPLICAIITLTSLLCSCTFPRDELQINISVLNGTTGFGAAKLMTDAADGKTELNYKFTVEKESEPITKGLINGSVDIAALPTNAAAALYNKTNGAVKIAAVNTLGVLYLVVNGEKVDITDLSELDGKTVYCPAQNPAFIFEAICRENNINVTIDTSYAEPAFLREAIVTGKVDIAVLPEPMVTIAKNANDKLAVALDLTDEWEKVYGDNTLMQGCIVVRTEWADAHPKELEQFLSDYEDSIQFTISDPKGASVCIAEAGIFAQAAVAEQAIPKCNIVFVDGEEMASALDVFFAKLYAINPKSVGGKIPDSKIYLEK
ncbi:MAG: ABC transporter substrate-binding protein [Clostridia bacterium]|nr:ABC transporter substrate-binding protein [Clostridia bacterium]